MADRDYYTIAYITKDCKSHFKHKGDGQTMPFLMQSTADHDYYTHQKH